jgi:hypothetical protein
MQGTKRSHVAAAAIGFLVLLIAGAVSADPQPGDVYREYWKATGMLRIGERWEWGGSNSGVNFPLSPNATAPSWPVDLTDAIRAEVTVSYDQCHNGTRGLRIAFNDHAYIPLPVPSSIPATQSQYMFWPFPTVAVPLEHLVQGANVFKMRVEADPLPQGAGGWMQNLVYGVILRVYYSSSKPHPAATITYPQSGDTLGFGPTLRATVQKAGADVMRVDFIGEYEDLDYDGDGIYREWVYNYSETNAQPANCLATIPAVAGSDVSASWDNTWVPDQTMPMRVAVRVVDRDWMCYMSEAASNVRLMRPGYSVEMAKPYNVKSNWVTRGTAKSEDFDLVRNPSGATDAKLVFRFWGSHDEKGATLNGGRLEHFRTDMTVPLSLLRAGKNTLTPDGNCCPGHHGMEINWPGVVVLVSYGTPTSVAPSSRPEQQPGRASHPRNDQRCFRLDGQYVGRSAKAAARVAPGLLVTAGSIGNRLVVTQTRFLR